MLAVVHFVEELEEMFELSTGKARFIVQHTELKEVESTSMLF
jgi:hypothetical protein